MRFASRLSPLLAIVERDAVRGVAYAEIWRRVGTAADRYGMTRPSYERIRVLAHEARDRAAAPPPPAPTVRAPRLLRLALRLLVRRRRNPAATPVPRNAVARPPRPVLRS